MAPNQGSHEFLSVPLGRRPRKPRTESGEHRSANPRQLFADQHVYDPLANQTGDNAIHPTPVIGVLGVHDDVRRRLAAGFTADGAQVVLLGATREEFGGSAWAHVVHRHLGGRPPAPDLHAERTLAALIATAAAAGLLASAHDVSDGGLGVALTESCLRGGRGCRVSAAGDPFTFLFSESAARAVVSVRPGGEDEVAVLCAAHGVPATVLGETGGDSLSVDGSFQVPLGELRRAWEGTLPALFG